MVFEPYTAQRLAEEQIKDRLREVERYRLIRAAQGPRKAQSRWTPVVLMLGIPVDLVVRLQS